MTTPALVALLTGFTALLAFALLVIRAFHKNTAWGLSVMLLSPPGAIAFGLKFWRQEKIVILAYLITFLTAVSLSLYLFTSWGGWELVRTSQQVKQAILDHRLSDKDVHTLLSVSREFDEHSGLDTQSSRLLAQARKELELQAEKLAAEEQAQMDAAANNSACRTFRRRPNPRNHATGWPTSLSMLTMPRTISAPPSRSPARTWLKRNTVSSVPRPTGSSLRNAPAAAPIPSATETAI